MSWDGVVRLRGETLGSLAARHGGQVVSGASFAPARIAPVDVAGADAVAPLLGPRWLRAAHAAASRGAALLVDASLATRAPASGPLWLHEHASWAMAALLDDAMAPDLAPSVGDGCSIAASATLGPRVVVGSRVRIGPGSVIGHPGFGWATGPRGAVRAIPQLGGVWIEDDVSIGPLCTIDAGTLAPTRVRRGAKLDAHVHVGHNGDIGDGAMIAAQCGFAGSVIIGREALVGGQVGIADHVHVGDRARIAAKSGVIGDVPAGAVMAGYPAVPRARWLRALAALYRAIPGRRAGPVD
ncbi:MAG TPA: UDP-3-O-(3-hydroxymyristoyl)glucosamine N-acyltransferase [Polyangiaceae bacterium]|nr:UDP-3-O-(3-hydroxymyristoyl)glucosamine N-acyltransferase [Polyangiaceae bacterium]